MTTIRAARPNDAGFIARTILLAQRGPLPRGWFDIALGWPEPQCLAFVRRIATAQSQSARSKICVDAQPKLVNLPHLS